MLSPRWDPTGTRVIAGYEDGLVRVWDVGTSNLIGALAGHESLVTSISIGPRGELAVSGSADNTVVLWDLEKRVAITRWRHGGRVNMVRFLADGRQVLSASNDQTLKLWTVDGSGSSLEDELALILPNRDLR